MDQHTPEDEIFRQYSSDLTKLAMEGASVRLEMPLPLALALLATLQLALRHPHFPEHLARIMRALARNLDRQLSITPALAEVIRRGWDPAFDVWAAELEHPTNGRPS